jgi:hypothetical protein
MNRYAILNSENKIHNIVIWNGDLSVWQPPENMTAIPIDEIDLTQYSWNTETAIDGTEEEAAIIILGSIASE